MQKYTEEQYVVIEKKVGETPLQALEAFRATHEDLAGVPLAYAGRLDPMASGKLLILIGDECKNQQQYHGLDKEYEFSVLFGATSDTGDVLGGIESEQHPPKINKSVLTNILHPLKGPITLPYPHFSSKTVKGKPLHVWTLENRLHEIEIPSYTARIYRLRLLRTEERRATEMYTTALAKINTLPPVTESSKALGRDFRRDEVRRSWELYKHMHADEMYTIATFSCICSSGLYMRSLAEVIAQKLDTIGLAFHIHRTKIGRYVPLGPIGFWLRQYHSHT